MRSNRSLWILGVATFVVLSMLGACGGDDDPAADDATSTTIDDAEPVGIIALGHSALTGENSDPDRPGQEVLENSWATGTSPEVNSVLLRLTALHPETEGHVDNAAQGGAVSGTLANQARSALAEVPSPELVIIETIDNDIRCDGSDAEHVPEFGEAVAEALAVISDASPNSRILIVSQPGRPATEAETIPEDERANMGGTGMCDFFDPDGHLHQDRLATLTGIIESYEAEQARVCAEVALCSTDDGVFTTFVRGPEDVTDDGNHDTAAGHAHLAALIWPTVERILEQ